MASKAAKRAALAALKTSKLGGASRIDQYTVRTAMPCPRVLAGCVPWVVFGRARERRDLTCSACVRAPGQAEEEDVFDVVDEHEYRKIVHKRRSEGAFVVDDGEDGHGECAWLPAACADSTHAPRSSRTTDGLGYADDGEEFLDGDIGSTKRHSAAGNRRGRGKGGLHSNSLRRARRLNMGAGAQTSKVDRLLATGDQGHRAADKKRKAAALEKDDSACCV